MHSRLPYFRKELLPAGTLSNHHRSTMPNVALQIFPLRADMARMRQFINSYLNFVDDDYPLPFYFKPAMPYVMLQILYYPYLAVTTGNTAWLTQREVSFSVPLEFYVVDDYGNRVFHHYATCSPFLYLDVQPTITSGRDLFGLPKVALKFQPLDQFFRPEEPELLTDLRLRRSGPEGDIYDSFLKVFQEPPRFTSTRVVRDALTAIPNLASTWISMMTGIWERTVQPPLRGYERTRDIASILQMGRAGVDLLVGSLPALSPNRPALVNYKSTADIRLAPINIDLISLKQFRDAEDTDYACYQSLVSSSLYTDRINAGGYLGDPLSTDLSGGAFVRIYDLPTQPLMDSFGLVAESRIETQSGSVWTIRPELPFWLNADLSFSLGTNLSWRTKKRSWSSSESPGPKTREMTQYNTFGGGALQEVPQRMISPDTAIFMLALPLGPKGEDKIAQLCHRYFGNCAFTIKPCLPTFRPITCPPPPQQPVVFMLVCDVLNSSEGAGVAREHEVQIVVPFSWSCKDLPPEDKPIGYGVFPIYAFSDSEEATITQSEVFGRPTVLADISGVLLDAMATRRCADGRAPADPYGTSTMRSNKNVMGAPYPILQPTYQLPVLNVNTSILGALYSGSQPRDKTLIQVIQGPRVAHPPDGNLAGDFLNRDLIAPWIGLKQVVDCRLPKRASYQSIVMQGMKLSRLEKPRVEDSAFEVRISRYQSIPIVETLDLKVDHSDPGKDTTIDTIKATFGIWLRTDMEAEPALNLCSRAGDSDWCCASAQQIKDRQLDNERLYNYILVEIVLRCLLKDLLLMGILPGPWWVPFLSEFVKDEKPTQPLKRRARARSAARATSSKGKGS